MNRRIYLRIGTVSLALAGVLFALFPLTRPWQDATGTDAGLVAATASGWWIPSHLFGALAFICVAVATTAVLGVLMKGPGEPAARGMALLAMLGAGLVLPFYGAESFGLHVIAVSAELSDAASRVALMDAVRNDPFALTTFGLGLLVMAAAGILLAVAVRRAGQGTALPAISVAVLLALYLPQFFGPPWMRIAHGLLLGISLLLLATWHSAAARRELAASKPQAGLRKT